MKNLRKVILATILFISTLFSQQIMAQGYDKYVTINPNVQFGLEGLTEQKVLSAFTPKPGYKITLRYLYLGNTVNANNSGKTVDEFIKNVKKNHIKPGRVKIYIDVIDEATGVSPVEGNQKVLPWGTATLLSEADIYDPQPNNKTVHVGTKVTPKELIANADTLPPNTSYAFENGNKVDTTSLGDKNATIVVTYPDKTTDEVNAVVKVIGKDNSVYKPIAKEQTVFVGDDPNADNSIEKVDKAGKTFPKGTTFAFQTRPKTDKAEKVDAKVVIHYPDNSERIIDVKINVIEKNGVKPDKKIDSNKKSDPNKNNIANKINDITTEMVIVKKGTVLNDSTIINHIKNAPNNAEVKIITKPSTDKIGDFDSQVEIILSDGTKKMVSVPVRVISNLEEYKKYIGAFKYADKTVVYNFSQDKYFVVKGGLYSAINRFGESMQKKTYNLDHIIGGVQTGFMHKLENKDTRVGAFFEFDHQMANHYMVGMGLKHKENFNGFIRYRLARYQKINRNNIDVYGNFSKRYIPRKNHYVEPSVGLYLTYSPKTNIDKYVDLKSSFGYLADMSVKFAYQNDENREYYLRPEFRIGKDNARLVDKVEKSNTLNIKKSDIRYSLEIGTQKTNENYTTSASIRVRSNNRKHLGLEVKLGISYSL